MPKLQVFDPAMCCSTGVLAARGRLEHRYIAEVRDTLAKRVALIPWQIEVPIGSERLRQIAEVAVSR